MRSLSLYYTGDDGKMHMGFQNDIPEQLNSNVLALINKIIYNINSRKGSNGFIPKHGSYVIDIMQLGSGADLLEVQSRLSATIKDIEAQIIENQSTDVPEATLKLLSISKLYYDPLDVTVLKLEIRVVTEANQEYILTV